MPEVRSAVSANLGKKAGFIVAGVAGFVLLNSSVFVIEDYERAVVTRFGEIQEVVDSGIHFKIPFVDSVHIADTTIEAYSITTEVATKDNQVLTATLTINHKIEQTDAAVQRLYTQFGKTFDYEPRILSKLAVDRVKSVLGELNIDEIIPQREERRMAALQKIKSEVSREYGIEIVDLQLDNFEFSPQYRTRLEQVAAARAKAAEAAQNEREAQFAANKAIETARGEAESKKLAAQAENFRVIQIAQANAEQIKLESIEKAEAIRREGQAKADALTVQAKALSANSEGLIGLTQAEAMKNWNGTVPATVIQGNSSASMVPFLNVNELMKSNSQSKK